MTALPWTQKFLALFESLHIFRLELNRFCFQWSMVSLWLHQRMNSCRRSSRNRRNWWKAEHKFSWWSRCRGTWRWWTNWRLQWLISKWQQLLRQWQQSILTSRGLSSIHFLCVPQFGTNIYNIPTPFVHFSRKSSWGWRKKSGCAEGGGWSRLMEGVCSRFCAFSLMGHPELYSKWFCNLFAHVHCLNLSLLIEWS